MRNRAEKNGGWRSAITLGGRSFSSDDEGQKKGVLAPEADLFSHGVDGILGARQDYFFLGVAAGAGSGAGAGFTSAAAL